MSNDGVRDDLDRVLEKTAQTLGIINTLLWIMAGIAALRALIVLWLPEEPVPAAPARA